MLQRCLIRCLLARKSSIARYAYAAVFQFDVADNNQLGFSVLVG